MGGCHEENNDVEKRKNKSDWNVKRFLGWLGWLGDHPGMLGTHLLRLLTYATRLAGRDSKKLELSDRSSLVWWRRAGERGLGWKT